MPRPGLANLGNTCFMNSLIQVLIDMDCLNKLFISNKSNNNLLNSFKKLYEMSHTTKENVIIPKEFHNLLQKKAFEKKNNIFTGFNQNDPSELLMFLLDVFHDEIKREVDMKINGSSKNLTDNIAIKCYEMKKKTLEKNYSEIYDLFYFIEINQIKENTNNKIEYIPQWSCQISLPLLNKERNVQSLELSDCIKNYVKENLIQDQNKSMKSKFWNFPEILVIVLQRFSSSFNKNNILVNFPINNLDMSNYVIGYNSQNYLYNLVGVCNHSGGIGGGHYTCFSKNKNDWYYYNDTQVTLVKNTNNIISNNAYCLFYKKKT